jgi:hypothetical protein
VLNSFPAFPALKGEAEQLVQDQRDHLVKCTRLQPVARLVAGVAHGGEALEVAPYCSEVGVEGLGENKE